jgi:hypothetical protein
MVPGQNELRCRHRTGITKESMIEKTYSSENLPLPLFAKEG